MLASALALAEARGEHPVAALTLLTSLLDFHDTGILNVFVDEAHALLRDHQLGAGGLMPGRDLATTFSFLRPNELVWNYVVGNYLKGQKPPAFDLLFWNGDSTNLPGPFFSWYFRNTYLENNLKVPGRAQAAGLPLSAMLAVGFVRFDEGGFGARVAHPFLHGRQRQHRVHVVAHRTRGGDAVGGETRHDWREERVGDRERAKKERAALAEFGARVLPDGVHARDVLPGGVGDVDAGQMRLDVHGQRLAQRAKAAVHLGGQ